jgi:hypothetical protein
MIWSPSIVSAFPSAPDDRNEGWYAMDDSGQLWHKGSEFEEWRVFGDRIPLPVTVDDTP